MTDSPPVPSLLRIVQQAVLGRWRATSDDLYREVVRLTAIHADAEVLVSGCGTGTATAWLAERTGAAVTGVDPDPVSVSLAEQRARESSPDKPIHYETAPLTDLPHETEVFDVAIGEPALSAASDPALAVAELARVVKPMGWVVLLQPTWTSTIDEEERERVVQRLELRPHLLVEWKQMLRSAGVVEIQVQDWTRGVTGGSGSRSGPVEVPLLGWRQKAQILTDALRRLGWRQARAALQQEAELVRHLSLEQSIGFQLLAGVKWHLQQEPS